MIDRNSLETIIENEIEQQAESIGDFNWRMSQTYWTTIVERSFKNGSSLYSEHFLVEKLLVGRLKNSVGPMLEACCSCASMMESVFGDDQVAETILSLCQRTSNRAKVFLYLAMSYYNGMIATSGNPMAMTLISKSYHSIAAHYNKHGKLPSTDSPSDSEIRQAAFQAFQPKKGCLIPFVVLTTGVLSIFAVVVLIM